MLRVGYRIRLSSGKGPDREGVVTALVGSMLRVRWSPQEETIVSPGPGTLTVLASSVTIAISRAPSRAGTQESRGQEGRAEEGCGEGGAEEGRRRRTRRRRRLRQEGRGRGRPRRPSRRPRLGRRRPPRKARRPRQVPERRRARVAARRRRARGPGSLISAARPARSPRECCERHRDQDDTNGQGRRQVDADLCEASKAGRRR